MKLKTEVYKEVEITYEVNNKGLFTTNALGILSSYQNPSLIEGWKNITDAEKDIKIKIDEFLNNTPKNYKELSKAIESSLVWTGYEDCYVDEFILKTIVENFIKYKNSVQLSAEHNKME